MFSIDHHVWESMLLLPSHEFTIIIKAEFFTFSEELRIVKLIMHKLKLAISLYQFEVRNDKLQIISLIWVLTPNEVMQKEWIFYYTGSKEAKIVLKLAFL